MEKYVCPNCKSDSTEAGMCPTCNVERVKQETQPSETTQGAPETQPGASAPADGTGATS